MDTVIKQGLLRKEPISDRPLSSILSKIEPPKWCVLAIRDGTPFFEFYSREEDAFTGKKFLICDLSKCRQITYTLSRHTKTFSFCIVLVDDVVQLVAPSKAHLLSWVKNIEDCLQKLGIIEARNDDHIYSFCPAVVNIIGHSTDGELEGAVGGEEEEDNPYDDFDLHANILDAEGENIFGTINEAELHDLERKASFGDENSQIMLNTIFKFDWMKEPQSLPIVEKGHTDILPSEDCSGSDSHVEADFWEQNKLSKSGPPSIDTLIAADDVRDDDDGLGDYCQLNESMLSQAMTKSQVRNSGASGAQPVVKSMLAPQDTSSSTSDRSSGMPLGVKSMLAPLDATSSLMSERVSNLPIGSVGGACSDIQEMKKELLDNYKGKKSSKPVKNSNIPENVYAPFPVRENVPDLINFDSIGAGAPVSNQSNNVSHSLIDVQPIPKPRKHSLKDNVLAKSHEVSITDKTSEAEKQSLAACSNQITQQTTTATENVVIKNNAQPSENLEPLRLSNGITFVNGNEGTKDEDDEYDDDGNYIYDTAFDPRLLTLPPMVPKRFDSLSPQDVQTKSDPKDFASNGPNTTPEAKPKDLTLEQLKLDLPKRNENGTDMSLPPRKFDSVTGLMGAPPVLPPRNKFKSADKPPPVPVRSLSFHGKDRPPPVAQRDPPVMQRQLSNRMRVDRASSALTVISLKQNQMEILKEEMSMSVVIIQVPVKYFPGLAFVDVEDKVWIAGWNVKEYPRLHDQFHIGDLVVHLNNVKVLNAAGAMKVAKNSESMFVDIAVQRLPKAKVFVIRRSAEGESLGIKREKGTAEIVYVAPDSLAGRCDLNHKPLTMPGTGTCNWFITEINNRALNLFYKDMEIEHRLGAVGRDISLVVQPLDFIQELKKHVKKLKGFKNYLIS